MLFLLAWRNIWRNKRRSLVITAAISFGILASVLADGYMNGMVYQMVNTKIEEDLGHIQIHHPKFRNEKNIKLLIKNYEQLIKTIQTQAEIIAFSERLIINGMISSASASRGVMIYGIDPVQEKTVTKLDSSIVEGDYFSGKSRNKILISPFMAKKLGARLRSKLVIRFQDFNGNITSAAFRVVGFFKSADARVNKMQVYVNESDLRRLAGIEDSAHELSIRLKDIKLSEKIAEELQTADSENLVQYWGDVAPELKIMSGYTSQFNQVFTTIVMLALLFGIMNTMLMSVLERIREFGTLIALGMNHAKVFSMVMIETIMLSFVGAIAGMVIAYFSMIYLSSVGIDLSSYSEGLSLMGLKHMIYPDSTDGIYVQVVLFVSSVAMVSAIYPGIKASRLQVTDAIRSL